MKAETRKERHERLTNFAVEVLELTPDAPEGVELYKRVFTTVDQKGVRPVTVPIAYEPRNDPCLSDLDSLLSPAPREDMVLKTLTISPRSQIGTSDHVFMFGWSVEHRILVIWLRENLT